MIQKHEKYVLDPGDLKFIPAILSVYQYCLEQIFGRTFFDQKSTWVEKMRNFCKENIACQKMLKKLKKRINYTQFMHNSA